MIRKPKISICMPVYNGSLYIEEALESLLTQTYSEFEVIISDDCSTDDTLLKIANFKDSRIKIYKHDKCLGLAGNWNRTIEKSSGEYIKFFFQDDILKSHCIKEFVDGLNRFENCNFLFSANEQVDDKGRVIRYRHPFNGTKIIDKDVICRLLMLKRNIVGGPSNVLIKRKLLIENGLFTDKLIFALDLHMWIKLSKDTDFGYIDKNLLSIREHKNSATSNLERNNKAMIDIFHMFSILEKEGYPNKLSIDKAKKRYFTRIKFRIIKEMIMNFKFPNNMYDEYLKIKSELFEK
jgi:glycosyltransferase involved in cell wall biosynthesis